jgi:hypothetical protein
MIEDTPKEIGSRGRLYTNERDRRELNAHGFDEYGYGCPVTVKVAVVDRGPSWGTKAKTVVFQTELGSYGEVTVPKGARDFLGVEEGDHVRLNASRIE